MPTENFDYVGNLNSSFPTTSDNLSQGDDHIRGIKAAIVASLPNIKGPVGASHDELNTAVQRSINGNPVLPDSGAKFKTNTLDGIENPSAGKLAITASDGAGTPTKQTVVEFTGSDKKASFKGPASVAGALTVTGPITGPGSVPIGGTIIWWEDTLPTDAVWAWANGQIIANANTVCPVLLARWGNRFGGNGVNTMGVPDLREVVPVGKSTMGSSTARGILTQFSSTLLNTIGGWFGEALHALTGSENGPHDHDAFTHEDGHVHSTLVTSNVGLSGGGAPVPISQVSSTTGSAKAGVTIRSAPDASGVAQGNANKVATSGTGAPHNIVQPSTPVSFIIRLA